MQFSVWAPHAEDAVEVLIGGERIALVRRERGRWAGIVPSLVPGVDYALSIDGGPPRPDPRSAHQPAGVDGPSRWVDHGSFRWSEAGWGGIELSRSVLYELHVGTFSEAGTFSGVIQRLDHMVELGVDAIELMPVVEFSGVRGWGYDCVDLWAPHSPYGGPDGLKELVDACHAKGLGVVLDVVYNHLGPAGNFLADFGPYFDDRHHTNWGQGINVDGPGSDEVRAFIVDNALMWLRDYHVDGLRLDAVHAIVDESALHVLEQLSSAVTELSQTRGLPLWLIAESDLNAPRFVRSASAGGDGLAASWADEWHHALHSVLTGETSGYYSDFGSMSQLVKALRQAWVYDGEYSVHRDRVHGRPPAGLSGEQFVVCAQNHDQIGNRAAGDRLGALTSVGRLKIAAALLLTGPFVPLLFQGEEWAASTPFQYFTDHQDPELGRAVSQGRQNEFAYFGWRPEDVPDPQEIATFERSRLRWQELAQDSHAEMLKWYRSLIALRRGHPGLACGPLDDVTVDFDAGEQWLVMQRRAGAISVAVNLGPVPCELQLGQEILLSSVPDLQIDDDGVVVLPADSVVVVDSSRQVSRPDASISASRPRPRGTPTARQYEPIAFG
ncbi:MAG: malto-oligosyltrehalose trehalohydrolase [Actinomycetota bacterium]|nr:malto-oligosyltrehalose trehalohydrolase [Actinomycetota bacterium]